MAPGSRAVSQGSSLSPDRFDPHTTGGRLSVALVRLGDATWPDADVRRGYLLAVPLGACEQHGPHLLLDTDTRIAVALAEGLAARRSDVVVGPPVTYGASGEHAGFPGTLSIGQDALEHLIVELVRSAEHWAAVVLVCGHGGNAEPLGHATRFLRAEGRRVVPWMAHVPGGDPHAGRSETSLLLALAPDAVRLDRVVAGDPSPLPELLPRLRRHGVRAVSPNGVLGDPAGASAAEGHALFYRLLDDLGRVVEAAMAET